MQERSRDWLRTFLHLEARADNTVPLRDIERQEDTVLRALQLLDEQPGVVLADEVGMGKTYEALGVIAARMHDQPAARTLILTPGPDLNEKWRKELAAFGDQSRPMYVGFRERFAKATTLAELVSGLRTHAIVVAPVSVFAGSRSLADQAYLLSAWADEQQLAGNQVAAIFRKYRNGAAGRVDLQSAAFLDTFEWKIVRPVLREALRAHRKTAGGSLDSLWKEAGYEAFSSTAAIDAAIADLRFRLLGALTPDLDLLVIDEAHKLKNADSVRATGVRTVFEKRFDKALFLTATPFQLTVAELSQVFALFNLAKSAPADLEEKADRLLADVREYAATYDDLDRVWSLLDGAGAADFTAWFAGDPDLKTAPDDPALRVVVEHARRLLHLKRDKIEPGFRAWMIRSLREDKRSYRHTRRNRLRPSGGPGVPFLLYERFIAELFRTNARTHKAAVQINMVSSFGAAREGALLSDEVRGNLDADAEAYRKMLQRVVSDLRDTQGGHPKVDHVVRDALEAAHRGEKTLIFCARVETLKELKREIESAWDERMLEAWRRVYPGAAATEIFDQATDETRVRGRHSKLQTRFQRGQDALYLALRERYVGTLLDSCDFAEENIGDIVRRANEVLSRQRLAKAHAERVDWSIVKRCVEQATALALHEAGRDADVEPDAMRRLLDPTFVPLGFDLVEDDVESFSIGERRAEWTIDEQDARLVLARVHLWSHLKSPLIDVPAFYRVRTVERLAGYLVSRYVPFLAELLAHARDEGVNIDSIEARALLPVVDRFWTTPAGRPWCDLLRRVLVYAGRLDEERRKEVLDDVVKAGAIVRHTVDGESRERLREAFNTPLYPMVLVANEVMQEGLDLHHHCRRVVHHDLAWNPAQLEQRVGRVDRLGSLVQRMRVKAPDTKLDISLPLIANTIDERLERTVRLRERWIEFLLGAPPRIEEYGLADDPAQPLPAAFSEALRVELGP
jgi:hypothetical protein